jgi:hypothetical protein
LRDKKTSKSKGIYSLVLFYSLLNLNQVLSWVQNLFQCLSISNKYNKNENINKNIIKEVTFTQR